jgi:hypothetical protein
VVDCAKQIVGCEAPSSSTSLQLDTPTRRLASKLLGLLSQPRLPFFARQPYQSAAAALRSCTVHTPPTPAARCRRLPAARCTCRLRRAYDVPTFVPRARLPRPPEQPPVCLPNPPVDAFLKPYCYPAHRQSAIVARHGSEQRKARRLHRPRSVPARACLRLLSASAVCERHGPACISASAYRRQTQHHSTCHLPPAPETNTDHAPQ